jgi:hypothetical protein
VVGFFGDNQIRNGKKKKKKKKKLKNSEKKKQSKTTIELKESNNR